MAAFDSKMRDLEQIETRLARQEQKTRIILIVVSLLAASAFTIWLGHILEPSWLPFAR
jgi:preprotein translocase subunit SecY